MESYMLSNNKYKKIFRVTGKNKKKMENRTVLENSFRSFSFIIFAVILIVYLPATSFALSVGPYREQVLDSKTEEPIEGASLFVYLTEYIPKLSPAGSYYYPELIKSMLVYTDNKGKYSIPITLISTGIKGSLESTSIIVYQPGYQAYVNINSIWNKKSGGDLKKKDNIILLDRIPPNFDHNKHYERIIHALSEMGDIHIISPIDYDVSPKGDTRMAWNKFLDNALLSVPKEEFLRRVEWENRRQ
jgi:hypothetical protein